MIVPSNRLLFWFGAIVLPFAAIGVMMSAFFEVSLALVAVFMLSVFIDAAFAPRRLEGIRLGFPEVIRLTKDSESSIDVSIVNETNSKKRLRLGLAFPREIFPAKEEVLLELPGENEAFHYSWPCTPLRRGSYFFEKCYLEHGSYLGFWAARSAVTVDFEVRVYPNLLSERKHLPALFLPRGNFGARPQRQVGQGRDFEKLRDYVHGDSYDSIHWKVTAKRGKPVTKVFQIERTQEVYVVVDASRLSGRDSFKAGRDRVGDASPDMILDRFIAAALIMGVAAEKQNDLFGILTFSDRVQRFIRAGSGKAHYNACRDALFTLEPRRVSPDFGELCAFMGTRLKRRSLIMLLTSLDDPALSESLVRNIGLLRKKHLVMVSMIRPSEAKPVFSAPDVERFDDLYERLGGHLLWHELLEVDKVLQKKGVKFSLLDNEKMSSQLVSQYISAKERQLI